MGAATKEKVRVFGRRVCVQCTATYRALDDRGIKYEPINADELRESAAEELRSLGFRQLPVVQAPGMVAWPGFRPD